MPILLSGSTVLLLYIVQLLTALLGRLRGEPKKEEEGAKVALPVSRRRGLAQRLLRRKGQGPRSTRSGPTMRRMLGVLVLLSAVGWVMCRRRATASLEPTNLADLLTGFAGGQAGLRLQVQQLVQRPLHGVRHALEQHLPLPRRSQERQREGWRCSRRC